jgi:hypothetical protein
LRTHVGAHPSNLSHARNQRKILQIAGTKIGPKISLKIKKLKNISAYRERWFNPNPVYVLMQIKSLQGVNTTQTFSHSFEDSGDLSLLSFLL